MVGVPGRSKACNTCRHRRIACSFERPRCAQCSKSNLDCGGYQRERKFIVSTSVESGPQSSSVAPCYFVATMKRGRPRLKEKTQSSPCEISPRNMYRQQLLSTYMTYFLGTKHFQKSIGSRWWTRILFMPDIPTALDVAVLALSTAGAGHLEHNPSLVRESRRLYTLGLHELRKALRNPSEMNRDETIAATLALSLYELYESPAANMEGFLAHQTGLADFIQLRGPHLHVDGLAHDVFLLFRHLEILRSVAENRPTFLSDSIWRTIPFSADSQQKSDDFMDLLCLYSDFLQEKAHLKELKGHERLVATKEFLSRARAFEAQVNDFYIRFQSTIPGPLYWPVLARADSPFPVEFHFLNLKVAVSHQLYWTVQARLWTELSRLEDDLRVIPTDIHDEIDLEPFNTDHELTFPDRQTDILTSVRNLCQSIDFFMQADMFMTGPVLLITPLICCIGILENCLEARRESSWMKKAVQRLHRRGLRFLTPLAREWAEVMSD